MQAHLIAELEENYERFIERVLKAGVVHVVGNDDELLCCTAHNGDQVIIPCFSDAAYARRALREAAVEAYEVRQIPLERYLGSTLGDFQVDDVLVGPNYTADMAGLELDPREVFEELKSQMSDEQLSTYRACLEGASILTIGHPPEKLERRVRRFAGVVAFDPDASPSTLVRGADPVFIDDRSKPGTKFIPLWSNHQLAVRACSYVFGSNQGVSASGIALKELLARADAEGWLLGVEPTIGIACSVLSAKELLALVEEAEREAAEADDDEEEDDEEADDEDDK
jgi:hypothetical protein